MRLVSSSLDAGACAICECDIAVAEQTKFERGKSAIDRRGVVVVSNFTDYRL